MLRMKCYGCAMNHETGLKEPRMTEQTTTEHNVALDVQDGNYTLVLSGPVDGIDDIFDAMRKGIVEEQLGAALNARIEKWGV